MAAGVQHITNHWESTVAPSVLEQYRERTLTDGQAEELGCYNRWQAMLKAVIDQMQIGEDATDELAHILDFNSAPPTGGQLDWVAGLINVTRYPGETDAHFFERFVNDLGRHNAGTPDGTIYSTALLSGDPKPAYIDEAPATFFVYTGARPVENGEQAPEHTLLLNWVRNIAPTPLNPSNIASSYVPGMDGTEAWTDMPPSCYETDYFASHVDGAPLVDTRSPIDFSGYGVTDGTPFVELKGVYDPALYTSFAVTMPPDRVFTLEGWYAASGWELQNSVIIPLLTLQGEPALVTLFLVPLEGRIYLKMSGTNFASLSIADTDYHHYAITCDGTSMRVFVDGTLVITETLGDFDKDMISYVDSFVFDQSMGRILGRFAQIAFSPKCKWTANFTPSTTAYSDDPQPSTTWEEGGRQLSRAQVRKMAPAGVLGLPGAALLDAQGNYITDAAGRLILAVADDSTIERDVLLADNNGAIVVTQQSVPVRVVLRGPSVPSIPTITTEWNGVPADAVRIKDLPDAGYENAFMVRDSETGGTTRIDENDVGLQMQPSGTNTLRFFKR